MRANHQLWKRLKPLAYGFVVFVLVPVAAVIALLFFGALISALIYGPAFH